MPLRDAITVAGDLNGHVSATKDINSCNDAFESGSRNVYGDHILGYAESHNLAIGTQKRDVNLYYSGTSVLR